MPPQRVKSLHRDLALWVVAAHAVILTAGEDVLRHRLCHQGDIARRDASRLVICFADRPAHDLNGGKAFVTGEVSNESSGRMAVTKPSIMMRE